MSIKTPEQQRTFEALATKLKGVAPTGPQMEEVQAAVDELLTVIGSRWEWCWAQPKFHKALNAILAASTAFAVTQGLLWLLAVVGFGPWQAPWRRGSSPHTASGLFSRLCSESA